MDIRSARSSSTKENENYQSISSVDGSSVSVEVLSTLTSDETMPLQSTDFERAARRRKDAFGHRTCTPDNPLRKTIHHARLNYRITFPKHPAMIRAVKKLKARLDLPTTFLCLSNANTEFISTILKVRNRYIMLPQTPGS